MEEKTPIFDYSRTGTGLVGVAALGVFSLVACLVAGKISRPDQFAFSYFCAWIFFFTICLGSLFWVMMHYATGAEWSLVVRRQFENVACLFDVLAVLFVPLIVVAPHLWPWLQDPSLVRGQWPWFVPWFFWLRTALYFAFFIGISRRLRAYSIRQDHDGDAAWTEKSRRLSLVSLPPFALCTTFAAIDWLMALAVPWHSSIWGIYLFTGSALGALCVVALIMIGLRDSGYFQGVFTVEHEHILGKLVFAFTCFWAYIAFSQYLIIWNANIPEETQYYLLRATGDWHSVGVLLVIGHFAVPFFVLLPCAAKRNSLVLCCTAVWLLLMHAVDVYLIVMPVLHRHGIVPSWLDIASFVAIGSLAAVVYLKRLGDSALWPQRDPGLPASVALKN